jgi:[protein-PII] uridylyltransferase
VPRPDLLLVAALLHDIGKGGRTDHSRAGEPVAAAAAARMGFDAEDQRTVATLVRRHLLLAETATSRDLDDPATVEGVMALVHDPTTLDLLEVLTEADARATGPQAWTAWRATLVADLTTRVRSALSATSEPTAPGGSRGDAPTAGAGSVGVAQAAGEAGAWDPGHLRVEVAPDKDGTRMVVAAPDRVGLMADIAGALGLLRMSVRSARAWTAGEVGMSRWRVDSRDLDPALVCQRLQAVMAGAVDPGTRIRARPGDLPPTVIVRHDASREATVLEVRTEDRLGVVFLVARALAAQDVAVRSAHLSTYGPQALDVFYVQEPGAGRLTDERAAAAAHAVRAALEGADGHLPR